MVGSLVVSPGQLHHCRSLGLRYGNVGTAAPVAVVQGGRSLLSVSVQKPPVMALSRPGNPGSLANGDLVFQDAVEHVEPHQFPLLQCHILHGVMFSLTSWLLIES